MKQFRALVTAGPTYEYLDPVRIITNPSSGKMGIAIAKELHKQGAEVTLIYGPGTENPPSCLKVKNVKTTRQMFQAVLSEVKKKKYHIIVAAAACADFTPIKIYSTKIPSDQNITIILKPTPKIINFIKKFSPKSVLVTFKAEFNKKKKDLIKIAQKQIKSSKADLVVVNDVSRPGAGFQTDTNEVYIVDSENNIVYLSRRTKTLIAKKIIDMALAKLERSP